MGKIRQDIQMAMRFDRDWMKIEDFVGSKIVIQIRSHAQKYFLKVQKNGTIAHVPPPRPKHPWLNCNSSPRGCCKESFVTILDYFSKRRDSRNTALNGNSPTQKRQGEVEACCTKKDIEINKAKYEGYVPKESHTIQPSLYRYNYIWC
ncbi:unnamed protein product [Cuscuta campestris]|uniref:HTH myb-type domain-containing protein n=1 Tax=Cuscuta campestris TaxID=132261 RepID=A0A484MGM9_9ASTE|nr:unnamed protein product [Cuscuta campestris]